ncbi:MAG: peptidylprolyl isomerase [Balneolales bacterium]|nr:peptidylprolyl isomerase [Balneolales bacterium]
MRQKKVELFILMLVLMGLPNGILNAQSDDYRNQISLLEDVWIATSERNELALLDFAVSSNPDISNAAWRALANMDVALGSALFDALQQSDSPIRWNALTIRSLQTEQLRQLENWLSDASSDDQTQIGILNVLGQNGDPVSNDILIRFMMEYKSHIESDFTSSTSINTQNNQVLKSLALAVSRSLARNGGSAELDPVIVNLAQYAPTAPIQASWLYGWYRNAEARLNNEALNMLGDWATNEWVELFGLTRQYLIAILSRHNHTDLYTHLTDEYVLTTHPLEGVETGLAINLMPFDSHHERIIMSLLKHENPQVRIAAIQASITHAEQLTEVFRHKIETEITTTPTLNAAEWLWNVQLLGRFDQDKATELLAEIANNNESFIYSNSHLIEAYLSSVRRIAPREITLQVMKTISERDASEPTYRAILQFMNQNATYFGRDGLDSEFLGLVETIGSVPSRRLDVTFVTFNSSYPVAKEHLSNALNQRIEQARESWSERSETLLVPDFDLLASLGPAPKWIIETAVGSLELRLDPLRSPATVTALALITKEDLHIGSPFHRIVPNFVAQAGELWQGDNNGSPYFRVPTEASEKSFVRGALGVASAGSDTEGSQFFIMLMWAPHLDGRYTNFGYLTEGFDVLDVLLQGEPILNSTIISSYE